MTGAADDGYVFKVPTLRNITLTPPTSTAAGCGTCERRYGCNQLGAGLTDDEVEKIVAFLGSLRGEQPEVMYPILPPSSETTPRPEPLPRSAGSRAAARSSAVARL